MAVAVFAVGGTALSAMLYAYGRSGDRCPSQMSYIVPNSADPKNGHGEIHRHPAAFQTLSSGPRSGEKTMYDTFQHGVRISGPNPCLGYRPIKDGKAQDFEWESYDSVNTRAHNLGSGLVNLGLIPVVKTERGDMRLMAIFLKNCKEWVIAEQGLFSQSAITVPMYDTLGPEVVTQIITETELTTILCSPHEFPKVLAVVKDCPTLKSIILINTKATEEKALGEKSGIKVYTFEEVEENGKKSPSKTNPPTSDTIATFCYTSGTTGKSKGALITHGNMAADMGAIDFHGVTFHDDDVHLSYLPLAHAFERIVQAIVYYAGGRVGFFQGKTELLLQDISTLRPTLFPSVPRLLNRIHDKITGDAAAAGGLKTRLFNMAYAAKLDGLRHGWLTHRFWDKLVMSKIQKKVGLDRCRMIITGSAPIAGHVLSFLRVVFCCPVLEGYGQTECTAGSNITDLHDYTVGHVGGPLPCNEIRLESVPEMNYLVTDTEHNGMAVCGRGEVCYRGHNVFIGYYKMPEVTAESLDKDGWLHSGDVGVWLPNGSLKIIDRKKNIFKLAQGEYVAPEKIENIYLKSEYVMQIFVYGDSLQYCLVGVVVPDPDRAKKWATEHGVSVDLNQLVNNSDFKKDILASIIAVGKADKLNGFEQVKDIKLHSQPFTPDDILTPSFKLKRNEAKKLFQADIDAMYAIVGDVAGKKVVQQDKQ